MSRTWKLYGGGRGVASGPPTQGDPVCMVREFNYDPSDTGV